MSVLSSVCFLRGINVSGKNMIRMADLVQVFTSIGFINVSTYLQSGNVVFSCDGNLGTKETGLVIVAGIKKYLDLDVPVVIRDKSDIGKILDNNLFLNRDKADMEKLYVTMLEREPESDRLKKLLESDFFPEQLHHSGNEMYILCPDGYGRAKLNNNFIEKKLAVTATTRNWKTMIAVREMLK